jgi:hypothetical protein
MRLGGTQTATYVTGIVGNTPAAVTNMVTVDTATNQLAVLDIVQNQPCSTTNMTATTSNDTIVVTIVTMSIQGVAVASPFPYPITYSKIANVVFLRLPAFQVTADAGGDPTLVRLGSGIPVSIRPTTGWEVSNTVSVEDTSTMEQTVYKIVVTPAGEVILYAAQGSNLTPNWGFQGDVMMTYTV